MEMFPILDVISLLGIEYPPRGHNSYNVSCPCCDDNPRKKHMNINLEKGVFRCPRCNTSGGTLDLYSLFTGISRDRVKEVLKQKLHLRNPSYTPPKKHIAPVHEGVKEYPIIDVESRHETYTAFLSKLSLAKDHKENLYRRGLIDAEIERLGYKTTPILGMSSFARQLRMEGKYLSGVPGFYREESGEWTFVTEKRGILIPVRDTEGLIQGLQIRLDNAEGRKFRWISSNGRKDGSRAEAWIHLIGEVKETAIITEGPMKADVINALSGDTVIAVPGVNSLKYLKETLFKMREKGLKNVQTAFDMDFLSNPYVQKGFEDLLCILDEMNFTFGTYLWDSRYKGLDDYIWEAMLQKHR